MMQHTQLSREENNFNFVFNHCKITCPAISSSTYLQIVKQPLTLVFFFKPLQWRPYEALSPLFPLSAPAARPPLLSSLRPPPPSPCRRSSTGGPPPSAGDSPAEQWSSSPCREPPPPTPRKWRGSPLKNRSFSL